MTNRANVLLALLLCLAATPSTWAEDDAETRIAIPSDPQTPVIELFQTRGVTGSGRPRRTLVVLADGTVSVAAGNGVARETRTRLSEEQLVGLLSELVSEHQLFECRTSELQQEVEQRGRAAGLDWRFPNATTSVIRVRLAGGKHEVRCTAAELLAERFPTAESVQNFAGVLERLQNLIAVTQIGGTSEAQRLCDIANSELRVTGGRRGGVTARHIQSVREDRQGLRFVQFLWDGNEESGARESLISGFRIAGQSGASDDHSSPPARTMSVSGSSDLQGDARFPNLVWRTYRAILRNIFLFWMDLRARGMRSLPSSGALLVSNHQSFLDPLLIGAVLERPVSYLARDNLFRVPFIGWTLRRTYVMPIRRDGGGTESIRESVRRMKQGFLVGIFPEGTRTENGELREFKPGFIALARHAKLPIVPIGIVGAHRVMPRGTVVPRRGRIRVVFGEPLPPEEVGRLSQRGREAEFVDVIRQRIQDCCNEADAWREQTG